MAYPDLPATRGPDADMWSALSAPKVLLGMAYLHLSWALAASGSDASQPGAHVVRVVERVLGQCDGAHNAPSRSGNSAEIYPCPYNAEGQRVFHS